MASTEKSSHLDTLLHLARSLALLNPSPWDKVVLHCIYVVCLNGKHLPYDLKIEEVYVADLIGYPFNRRKHIGPWDEPRSGGGDRYVI